MQINIPDDELKAILLRENYITAEDVAKADEYAAAHHAAPLDYLLSENIVTKGLIGQAIAESVGLPYADLDTHQPPKEQVLQIPETIARKHRIVIYSENEAAVTLATDQPQSADINEAVQQLFPDKVVNLAYAFTDDIDFTLRNYQKSLETRFNQIISGNQRVAPEILEEILADAFAYNASDVHFEPQGDDVIVRFRIDGVIQEAGRLPKDYYGNIINRVKVQSSLRIDEHFAAQDGSMRFSRDNITFDLRTSIIPTVEGEKIVLRLLASYLKDLSMANIGLTPENQQILHEASHKPFGMILVVGPTGSGKTTTLYAALSILNQPNVNITTIEDPVEYRLKGINQIQVRAATGLTFEKGLRSIVRQDPDIILVGEVRDQVTAEISVNAALTGHMLLSTFHANDASTALPRLLDMGIEPFLLASTLELVIAQRLVRKLCATCRFSVQLTPEDVASKFGELADFFGTDALTLYESKGCSACGGTGFKGRTGVYEFIRMTPELRELALTIPSAQAVWQLASAQGARSMFEDGIEKVKNGLTTVEELLRVAEPPEDAARHADMAAAAAVRHQQSAVEPEKPVKVAAPLASAKGESETEATAPAVQPGYDVAMEHWHDA